MRWINIFIGFVILTCIITVSYSHTVLLFNSVGIVGWKGHLATIAVEATFILSCFNLVVARLKKFRPGFFAVAGFFYGSGLTAWSNISFSFEYGITGWILGAAIPVGLWIAEGIISHSLLKKPTNQDSESQTNQTESSSQEANQTTKQTNQDVVSDQKSNQPNDNQPEEPNQTEISDQDSNQEDDQTNQEEVSDQKPTKRRKPTNKAEEEARIKKAYLDYFEQNGEPPSQRKWADLAGVSRYKIIKFIEKYGEPKKSV